MIKNLRKGSKVFVSIGLKGVKKTKGVVVSKRERDAIVRITCGPKMGQKLVFLPREIKRRSK